MTIEGFSHSTNAMPDEAVESVIDSTDLTQSSAQQAGEDVSGTGTAYESGESTDLDAKTEEIISKIEEVQVLLEELITSLSGEAEAPAGQPTGTLATPSEAPVAEPVEVGTADATEPVEADTADAGEPDLTSLTEDVSALLDQISAIVEGEEASADESEEASEASSANATTADDTEPAAQETSSESAQCEEGSDVETLLEQISASLDKIMSLLGGGAEAEAEEETKATEPAGVEDTSDAENSEATAQSDGTESTAEASSDAELQLLLEDLSGSLGQVTELLGSGAEDVKADDAGETATTASDAEGSATATANAEITIVINQGENGEILVSTQPTEETSTDNTSADATSTDETSTNDTSIDSETQETKSDDSEATEVAASEEPVADAATTDADTSGISSASASANVNLTLDLSGLGEMGTAVSDGADESTKSPGETSFPSSDFDSSAFGGPSASNSSAFGGPSASNSSAFGGPSASNSSAFGESSMSSFSAPATYSPLILDTDQDGSVEATAGMGVDINGDGTADGAATGGDKMLAMSDITGDGEIGGAEVFGNMTVDPFSGEQLNAENGFEALQMVAVSAEEQTGVECIDDNGVVDLQSLSQALESEGIGLGMISGDNNTSLESLGDVASIDTANYVTQQDTGDVQHNQLGSYEDTSGDTHKVDDVWFSGN
ncbi:MAG: hypothetical protein PVJ19_20485 [Desulfobacteraceae bacterium]|jgi:hypothetical protein